MKKIFTFCFFAFALLIGTQSAIAQNKKAKVNDQAYTKTKELRSQVKFDDATLEKVYNAYQAHQSKMVSVNKHLTSGTSEYNETVALVDKKLQTNLKMALGSDLFDKYLAIKEKQKAIVNSKK